MADIRSVSDTTVIPAFRDDGEMYLRIVGKKASVWACELGAVFLWLLSGSAVVAALLI